MNQKLMNSTINATIGKNESESETDLSNSPFVETTCDTSLFLGVVNKRYLRTFHGMVHGIGSMFAIVFGNIVFVNRVVLGVRSDDASTYDVLFHACNFTASAVTAIFFWNKVQSWQLSATSMKEKGLTPKALQKLNQGRGVVSMILFSLYPTVCFFLPSETFLESRLFSVSLALILMVGSAYILQVFQDYLAVLWVVYGMTSMAIGISILNEGTVSALNDNYPLVMDRLQKEASFVINCTQVGFMLYYLYSRRLVSKSTVQSICKAYHIPVSLVFLLRAQYDLWLPIDGSGTFDDNETKQSLPWPMMVQPMILALAMSGKMLPLLAKMGVAAGSRIAAAVLDAEANAVSKLHAEEQPNTFDHSLNEQKRKYPIESQHGHLTRRPRRRSSASIRIESTLREPHKRLTSLPLPQAAGNFLASVQYMGDYMLLQAIHHSFYAMTLLLVHYQDSIQEWLRRGTLNLMASAHWERYSLQHLTMPRCWACMNQGSAAEKIRMKVQKERRAEHCMMLVRGVFRLFRASLHPNSPSRHTLCQHSLMVKHACASRSQGH